MENIEKNEVQADAKSIAKELFNEMKADLKAEFEASKKSVEKKSIDIREVDMKIGNFNSRHELNSYVKNFLPEKMFVEMGNTKALSNYANITTDADGGSFDPVTANGVMARSITAYNSYEEDTRMVRSGNSSTTFIDVTGGVSVSMVAEAGTPADSKISAPTRTIVLKKMVALCPLSEETLKFGTLADIANETYGLMGNGIAEKKQHLIFMADGTADTVDSGITGIVDALTNVANNASILDLNGDWDSIDIDTICTMVAMVSDWANPLKLSFYCNKALWGKLEAIARKLGGNTYMQMVGQVPVPTLMGYPVKFVNKMPKTHTPGTPVLLFGDLSGAVATSSTAIESARSDSFYFDQGIPVLRSICYFGVNAYQPGTSSAATSIVGLDCSAS